MTLRCPCGSVHLQLERPPAFIHQCNCSLCTEANARWGYFDPSQVKVLGETEGFRRADKETPSAELRFCPSCSATTHFVLTEMAVAQHGNTAMGVNMSLADRDDLRGIEQRYPDGESWDGVGEFGYVREPDVL